MLLRLARSRARALFCVAPALIALAPLGLRPAAAAAAPPRKPSLHWTRGAAASTCIDSRALAARVEALTGRVFVAPQDSDYAIEGHIDARRGGGFMVRLAVSHHGAPAAGERVLEHEGADCRTLDDALAFVIALTIDPDLELTALLPNAGLGERSPEEVLLQELDTVPPVPAAAAASVAPVNQAPLIAAGAGAPSTYWEVALGALYGARELPEPSLGFIANATYQGKHSLAASSQLRSLSMLRSTQLEPDLSMRSDAFAAALLACVRGKLWRPLRAGLCAGPEPELIATHGLGFTDERAARLVVWGALAQVEGRWRFKGPWSLAVHGLLRVNLQTKRFVYSRAGVPYEAFGTERIGLGAALTLGYALGSGTLPAPVTHVQDRRERAR